MTDLTQLSLSAPAKLNLMLHILNRREDGYHNLQTLFQFLDYSDELIFTRTPNQEISISPELQGLKPEDNLIYKAALLLQQHTKSTYGAEIECKKILPMGGGLGGGSSNAATTLLALNYLWKTNLNHSELAKLGLQIGADVPVFIYGKSAWAQGVGEKLEAVEELAEPYFLVINPNIEVNTGRIFSHKELTRNSPASSIRTALANGGRNDCEPLVRKLYPEIDKALNLLNKFSKAKLTGTGGCVFASFDKKECAQKAHREIPADWISFIAKGVNTSPTHKKLSKL